jgi:vacuolar-type H+-ATPase subunit E/Vma4
MTKIERLAHALVHKLEGMAIHENHYAALRAALQEADKNRADHELTIKAARLNYCWDSDSGIEIDEDPLLSVGDDVVWVNAWVKVTLD